MLTKEEYACAVSLLEHEDKIQIAREETIDKRLDTLTRLARTHFKDKNGQKAGETIGKIIQLAEKEYSQDNKHLLPILQTAASLYTETQNYIAAADTLDKIYTAVKSNSTPDEQIKTLESIADQYIKLDALRPKVNLGGSFGLGRSNKPPENSNIPKTINALQTAAKIAGETYGKSNPHSLRILNRLSKLPGTPGEHLAIKKLEVEIATQLKTERFACACI